MPASRRTSRIFRAAEVVLLAGALTAAALISREAEWHPFLLVALLLALAVGAERFTVPVSGGVLTVSASLVVLVLTMGLLGPAPAVVAGTAGAVASSAGRRRPVGDWLTNLSTFAVLTLVGGLIVKLIAGDVHGPHGSHITRSVTFALIVFAAFAAGMVINFAFFALDIRVHEGSSIRRQVREMLLPMLPGMLATAVLAVVLAVAYAYAGLAALFAAVLVMLIFQHLAIALVRSEDRAEKLEARTIHLAKLQLGVLAMLMEALALRDSSTSRHATAVARYARALAQEAGCGEEEQEVVHTAALLHDIGKFTWSDRALHPESLTDADWEMIRRHPQDGAALVGKLDGYGPVADAILYHHERVDGGGYPAGLIGKEIPLASRIVAICSTYDTMTNRNAASGEPMAPSEAMGELKAIAGRQLDAELVDLFIAMLGREGAELALETNFEQELAFDQRVRRMAQP
jgi:putative nucleotidyltransferase with HDIG domain